MSGGQSVIAAPNDSMTVTFEISYLQYAGLDLPGVDKDWFSTRVYLSDRGLGRGYSHSVRGSDASPHDSTDSM